MRNKDWIRRNHWKLWTNESAILFVICACQNCCVKLQRNQHICWLIKRSMFSRYWSEFNKISIKVNFLIAQRTWDENSIDFFFFLDIRSCIMSVVNKKKLSERRMRKMLRVSRAHFHFVDSSHFLAFPGFWKLFHFTFRSTSLSAVAGSPSVFHFSSHMGQLMRHSADTIGGPIQGCSMLWPNCPISSDKLMRISTKVRLRWFFPVILSLTCF